MQQPQLSLTWTSKFEKTKAREIEKRILENKDLFSILDEILEEMLLENKKSRNKKDSYEMPAWSEFQADANAVERTVDRIRHLLKFTNG